MSPFIRDGDVITVAPSASRSFRLPPPSDFPPSAEDNPSSRICGVGQVVAFVSPGSQRLVVHRIVGRRDSSLLILGDGMAETVTEAVSPDRIVGRVVRIERRRKRVLLGLGPERYVVAVLSRAGLLHPFLRRASRLTHILRRRPHAEC